MDQHCPNPYEADPLLREPFDLFEIPSAAPIHFEPMGSRWKFWFELPGARCRWLFKQTRPEHQEDWTEVVVARIASELGLPCAAYRLARYDSNAGVVTPRFSPDGFEIVFGNELLGERDPTYPTQDGHGNKRHIRTCQHTIDAVAAVLGDPDIRLPIEWDAPAGVASAAEVFGGYLLLDALVGNTDRHHENWGVLKGPDSLRCLAPTFDHSASLGAHESDEVRLDRLRTRNRKYSVDAYVARSVARSALFGSALDRKPLPPLDALLSWQERFPTMVWVTRLAGLSTDILDGILGPILGPRISGPGRAFARAMLEANKRRILEAV